MAETKRITFKLPDSLTEEIEEIVSMEDTNRGEFIKEAMRLYLREKKRIQIMESMKNGYLEMSHINRSLSEIGFSNDMKDFLVYEMNLLGCGTA